MEKKISLFEVVFYWPSFRQFAFWFPVVFVLQLSERWSFSAFWELSTLDGSIPKIAQ
jgi:hypothetical protein